MYYFHILKKEQAEILKLSVMELWVKYQSGQLTAQDAGVVIDTLRDIFRFFRFQRILKLSLMELWVKLQSGQLTAQDAAVVVDTFWVIFRFLYPLFSDFFIRY